MIHIVLRAAGAGDWDRVPAQERAYAIGSKVILPGRLRDVTCIHRFAKIVSCTSP